ncbi:hypothetical protein Hanom_Chr13g01200921 [Helianthus anomalus]
MNNDLEVMAVFYWAELLKTTCMSLSSPRILQPTKNHCPFSIFSRNSPHTRERGGLKEQDLLAATNNDDDGGFTVIMWVYN